MSLLFLFCDLEISQSSFNSLNHSLQFLCYLAWLSTSVGAIPLPSSKNVIFNGIGRDPIFSNSWIAEAAEAVFSGSISERFVPKGHCWAPSLLSWQKILLSQSTDPLIVTFVAGLQTFLSNISLTWCNSRPYTSQDHTLTEANSTTTLSYSTYRPQVCTLCQHYNMIVSTCRVCWEIL